MRMAVKARWLTVSGPPCVRDSGVGNKGDIGVRLFLLNQSLQLSHLADLLESEHFVLLISVNRNTGGVVSAVLKSGQACKLVRG